jgi:hypothetical protein
MIMAFSSQGNPFVLIAKYYFGFSPIEETTHPFPS